MKGHSSTKNDNEITLILVREAGSLMKLYCDKEKQMKAWNILYNMATVLEDASMIVSGKTFKKLLSCMYKKPQSV